MGVFNLGFDAEKSQREGNTNLEELAARGTAEAMKQTQNIGTVK